MSKASAAAAIATRIPLTQSHNTPAAATDAVITLAAPGANKRHVVLGVTYGYTAAPAAATALTVVSDSVTLEKAQHPAAALGTRQLEGPYIGGINKSVVITLPSGAGSVVGTLTARSRVHSAADLDA